MAIFHLSLLLHLKNNSDMEKADYTIREVELHKRIERKTLNRNRDRKRMTVSLCQTYQMR
jgi:hypothetical protein